MGILQASFPLALVEHWDVEAAIVQVDELAPPEGHSG
jgi:hypothetical protein